MARSGFDDSIYANIITKTTDALGEMTVLNNNVSFLGTRIPVDNNSDSGRRLARMIERWNTDYNTIWNRLDHMNKKAQELRQLNLAVIAETSDAAPH